MQQILAIFAHPDDEAFGPGGTLALWASQGHEISLICATKGEAGNNHTNRTTAETREQELRESAKILGIKSIEFLDYIDGEIGNNAVVVLQEVLIEKIKEIKPDILLTFNLNGVSGHLDHIAVASATTFAHKKTKIAKKLYYYTTISEQMLDIIDNYFINVPQPYTIETIDEAVDISSVWETKVKAMHCHQSQMKDVNRILARLEKMRKQEFFVLY